MLPNLNEQLHKEINNNIKISIPLSEQIINGTKEDWVLLKLTIPIELRNWLDTNKKLNGITYSKYIRKALLDNYKCKQVFLKIINNKTLDKEDYKFIEQLINNFY